MKQIGLLSDTHAYLHPGIHEFFSDVNEIWHCGDMGNIAIADELLKIKPLRAVYGNIDGQDVRLRYPEFQLFNCEDIKVLMTHIGGYPGRYEVKARQWIEKEKPGLFVCGHSHILKVIYDKKHSLLHINPGAAGKYGLHQVITFVRFKIEGNNILDLEIAEYERKQTIVNQ
jgi:uncharacterized protein